MVKGSLVAFHDYLKNEKQLDIDTPLSVSSPNTDYSDPRYQAVLGGAIRKLQEIGIRQVLIDKYIANKGSKTVVKTVLYCIERDAVGKVKGSLRAYMKALNDCGWTVKKVFEVIAKFKGDLPEFRYFQKLDNERKLGIVCAVAQCANLKNILTPIDLFREAESAVAHLKFHDMSRI